MIQKAILITTTTKAVQTAKPVGVIEKVKTPPVDTSAVVPATSPFLIKTRSPEDKNKFLRILVHGDSGTGKTWFAGTMIQAGLKTIYIVFEEDELLTLDKAGIYGYDYRVITRYDQLWRLYLELRKNDKKWEGLILDSLTYLQQNAKDFELGSETDKDFLREAMLGNRRMYLQNWGNLLEMTRHFIVPVLKLPMHKIFTCVSEPDEDPKTGKSKIYPALQGSMQQLIDAYFSVVAYSFVYFYGPETHFCLTTQPHECVATKDRTGLCRVQINPKFQNFLDSLNGKPSKASMVESAIQRSLILRPQASTPKVEEKK